MLDSCSQYPHWNFLGFTQIIIGYQLWSRSVLGIRTRLTLVLSRLAVRTIMVTGYFATTAVLVVVVVVAAVAAVVN